MAGGTLLSLWAKNGASKAADLHTSDGPINKAKPSQPAAACHDAEQMEEERKAPEVSDVVVLDEDDNTPPSPPPPSSPTQVEAEANSSPEATNLKNSEANVGSSASKVVFSPLEREQQKTPKQQQQTLGANPCQESEEGRGYKDLTTSDSKQLELRSPPRSQQPSRALPGATTTQPPGQESAPSPAETLAALYREAESLQAELQGLQPLVDPMPPANVTREGDLPKTQIALMVQGSPLALSELSETIWQHTEGGTTKTSVHNSIIGIAARTSFTAPDGRTDTVDALEDSSPDLIWRWTLRDIRVLPKDKRQEASQLAKRLQGGLQRLTALREACALLGDVTTPHLPAKGKLPKLLARLEKLRLPATEGGTKATADPTPAKSAPPPVAATENPKPQLPSEATVEEKGDDGEGQGSVKKKTKELKEAERQRLKEEKEEAARMAKEEREAERVRQREEKEAAARKAKEEKLAAAEEQRSKRKAEEKAERENKKAAKSGFASSKALNAAQNTFMNFLAKAAPKAPARGSDTGPSPAEAADQSFYHQLFVPCPASQQQHRPLPAFGKNEMAELEGQLQPGAVGPETLEVQQDSWRIRWREQRAQQRQRHVGVPPSWARKADRQPQVIPEGVQLNSIVTYRRKLIQKNATAPRPAYYGSWSMTSAKISARKPFSRDESLEIDYDVESELDWDPEEEDQGESLSDADEQEVEGEDGSEADEDGGFCVPDGYLSEDEGGADVMAEDEDSEEDSSELAAQPSGATGLAKELTRLQIQLEKAKRGHKCLLVTRQDCCADEIPPQLHALRMQVLCPHKTITVPQRAPAPDNSCTAAGKPKQSAAVGKPKNASGARGGGAAIFPETHLKSLLQFLADSPKLRINQAMEAFIQLHPSDNLAKTAVRGKILTVAERSTELKCWVIRPELVEEYGVRIPERSAPKRKSTSEKNGQSAKKAKKESEVAAPAKTPAKTPSKPSNKLDKFFNQQATPAKQTAAADTAGSSQQSLYTPAKKSPTSDESSGSGPPVFESPAAPLPDAESNGAVIEDHPSSQFWQDLRRWLVKGGVKAREDELAKGFAFAMESCVTTAIGSMPVDIFTALVKTMGSPAESPLRAHAAEAATNIAAALRQKTMQAPSGSVGQPALLAWPRVIQTQDVLKEALLVESCTTALGSGDAKLQHHVSKLLAAVTQTFKDSNIAEAEAAAAAALRRQLAANGRLLFGLATVVEEGVPEGLKASAYACMALREILAEASRTEEDHGTWQPDLEAFANVAVTVSKAVAGADNAQHLPVTKHALRLAADMLSCEGVRDVVLGEPPVSATGNDSASALLRGAAAALGGDQGSAMEAALRIVEHLVSVEGDVRSGLSSMASGQTEGYGPNISGTWLGLQRACKQEAQPGVQKLAKAIVAIVTQGSNATN